MAEVDARFRGPWPDARAPLRAELHAYLGAAADPRFQDRPTRCPPWTVCHLTAHLATTFSRISDTLERNRRGDPTPPFAPDEMSEWNLRAVASFEGEPAHALHDEAERWLALVGEPEEMIASPRGLVPVGFQMLLGLNEVSIHHDDLAHAAGRAGRVPPGVVIDALVPLWEALGHARPDGNLYAWAWILAASGR